MATKKENSEILDTIYHITGWHRDHTHQMIQQRLTESGPACISAENPYSPTVQTLRRSRPLNLPRVGGHQCCGLEAAGLGVLLVYGTKIAQC